MKTIYYDSEFKCHVTNDGTMDAIETDFFDGKSNDVIEGYRYIPKGKSWEREDGVMFHGEMIAPFKDFNELLTAQLKYELAEYEALINELYAEVTAE